MWPYHRTPGFRVFCTLWTWLVALLLTGLVGVASAEMAYRPDRILVRFREATSREAISSLHNKSRMTVVGTALDGARLQILALPPGARVPETLDRYRRSGLVEFAEPDYIRHLAATTPNDPKYLDGTLWHLNNFGQNGGALGADIHATQAWDTSTSAADIVVAVLDSGVRYTHEDLAANMWANPVDGGHGWNALTGTNNPVDSSGHGTLAAGLIGACGNNGKGVVGVAWKVQIMACTCFDSNGNGSDSDIIACMDYARTNGAQIINASWGSYADSLALSNAIFQLRQDGIILVAAAGNDARNIDVSPYYPACHRFDNIVSVGYSTRNDTLGTFSNFGSTNVDLIAPGAGMYSTFFASDSSYLGNAYLEGTSLSAPIVTGALALLLSKHPAETHQQILARLLHGVDAVPALRGKCSGAARLNLDKAFTPPILLNCFVSDGRARVRVTAEPGTSVVVESGIDLLHWTSVQTNVVSDTWTFEYSESSAQGSDRFYRAVAKR